MSAARPPLPADAATPGLPSMSDSGFKRLFTATPQSVQSGPSGQGGSVNAALDHGRKVQTELLLDDIRAALNENIDYTHFMDEGRSLFRATWSPLSAFAHPRNPKKGLHVPVRPPPGARPTSADHG